MALKRGNTAITLVMLAFMFALPAQAYVGPGAGAGVIAVAFGIFGAIIIGVVAVIYYPLKRVCKSLKSKKQPAETKPPQIDEAK